LKDLADSVRFDRKSFENRPWTDKLAENFCRLFSPIL
jgi:hypothetical protein